MVTCLPDEAPESLPDPLPVVVFEFAEQPASTSATINTIDIAVKPHFLIVR